MNRLRVSFHSYVHYVKIKYVGEINMKKLLVILAVLLLPLSASAGNIFSHIFKGKNYAPLCSTFPASSPVTITLREIGYESDTTNSHELIKKGFADDVTKIICKVYFVKYSDGTSEGFNPDL